MPCRGNQQELELLPELEALIDSDGEFEDDPSVLFSEFESGLGQSARPFESELEEEVDRRSSEYVEWLQRSLNGLIGAGLVVDGDFGRRTRHAVRRFQRQAGITIDGKVGSQTEAALIRAGAPVPGETITITATPPARRDSTGSGALRSEIVRIANQEWRRWNPSGRPIRETSPRMSSVLRSYWQAARVSRRRAEEIVQRITKHPWSAAFISWVMRQAGAGRAFRYSPAHWRYIAAAKQNRIANNSNPIKAYQIGERPLRPGDLLCNSRSSRRRATYDNIDEGGFKTHCDIVVDSRANVLHVIGGNVRNSVTRRAVRTDSWGRPLATKYFAVLRVG